MEVYADTKAPRSSNFLKKRTPWCWMAYVGNFLTTRRVGRRRTSRLVRSCGWLDGGGSRLEAARVSHRRYNFSRMVAPGWGGGRRYVPSRTARSASAAAQAGPAARAAARRGVEAAAAAGAGLAGARIAQHHDHRE